ncbi:MAG: hypothetical protein JNM94_18615 [Phycisphaerae bacterium]|nr:hypothetical protein [Phycisphaerae bacterium]
MEKSLPMRDRSPILRWLRGVKAPPQTQPMKASRPEVVVAEAELPVPIGQAVLRVVRRAGGTRKERSALAMELVAHFRDSLAAGVSADAALAAFGSERTAAALLRRAIRRKRGWLWASWWWSSRAALTCVLALAVAYGWAAARFWLLSPTISKDYVAEILALDTVRSGAQDAWPRMRDALRALARDERSLAERTPPLYVLDERYLDDAGLRTRQREQREFVERNRSAIETLRSVAREPIDSGPMRPNSQLTPEDVEYLGASAIAPDGSGAEDDSAAFLRLPKLAAVQHAARFLELDARVAAREGDGARATSDVLALFELGRAVRRPTTLVEQLVSNAISATALALSQRIVLEHPQAFSNEQLASLVEALALITPESLALDFRGEELVHRDFVQRMFSDDGSGDGRLVAGATEFARQLSPIEPSSVSRDEFSLDRTADPIRALTAPSRREVAEALSEAHMTASALQLKPWWQWTGDDFESTARPRTFDELPEIAASVLTPTWSRTASLIQGVASVADAARALLGVELYRREHGHLAASISEIAPYLRGRDLHDPFDGAALRYAVENGVARLWTVGPDGIDDGGAHGECNEWTVDERFPIQARMQYGRSPTSKPPPPRGDITLWRFPIESEGGTSAPPSSAREVPCDSLLAGG